MQTRSATKAVSSREALRAQQKVLEVNGDLLREVLDNLGTSIAECHAVLLVDRKWGEAVHRYDWGTLL